MNTTSKIARLPRDLRDKLNVRLHDGDPGNKILDWLNRDKTVRQILKEQFDSSPITKQNLSQWKNRGGYQDWKNHRDVLEFGRELSGDADEVFSVCGQEDEGSPAFADKMALWFSVRYMVMAKSLITSVQNKDLEKQEPAMRRILRDLSALRRSEHSAGRLRLEHKRLEFQKTQGTDAKEKAFWERARSAEVEKELNKTREKTYDEKEADARMREVSIRLFGSSSLFLTPEESKKMEEYENSQKAEDEYEDDSETPEPETDSQQSSPTQSNPVKPSESDPEANQTPASEEPQPETLNELDSGRGRGARAAKPETTTPPVQTSTESWNPELRDPYETGGVLGDQHDRTRNTARDRNSVDFTDPYGIKKDASAPRRRRSCF